MSPRRQIWLAESSTHQANCRAIALASAPSGGLRPRRPSAFRTPHSALRISPPFPYGTAPVLLARCYGIAPAPLPCASRNALELRDLRRGCASGPALTPCAPAAPANLAAHETSPRSAFGFRPSGLGFASGRPR